MLYAAMLPDASTVSRPQDPRRADARSAATPAGPRLRVLVRQWVERHCTAGPRQARH